LILIQREGDAFRHAAKIALDSLLSVWLSQREESNRLIKAEHKGRRKKNQAENGKSPTLWLEDDRAGSVAEKFWVHTGISNLLSLKVVQTATEKDDTEDDLVGFDPNLLGHDGAERIVRVTSGVKRDPAVRREVMLRSNLKCESPDCGASRDFAGFLDVHHILGAEKSDRYWTCVALCPNCHREAHFSSDRDSINRRLLEFARQFFQQQPK
jgi:5-methylcytosine-specific restriction enzyme A